MRVSCRDRPLAPRVVLPYGQLGRQQTLAAAQHQPYPFPPFAVVGGRRRKARAGPHEGGGKAPS